MSEFPALSTSIYWQITGGLSEVTHLLLDHSSFWGLYTTARKRSITSSHLQTLIASPSVTPRTNTILVYSVTHKNMSLCIKTESVTAELM